jgi:hypothetical protein
MMVWIFLPWAILARDHETKTEVLHTVSRGETLAKIARRYFPLTEVMTIPEFVQRIREQNGLEGNLIRPDQCLSIPVVRSVPFVSQTVPKSRDFEAKGIYINRYTIASPKMSRLVERLVASGGNTVVLDGKDMSGRLSYSSKVEFAREIASNSTPSIAAPSKLFHSLHEKGLHVCVRLVLFYDPWLVEKRPDLAIRSRTDGGLWRENGKAAWVDPSNPTVQRYNLDLAKELASMGVDEIQFDYIRFPTMGNTQDASYGFDEEKVPKHKIITGFLAQARQELSSYELLLSVDVFGVMGWRRPEDLEMTGQRVEDLAKHCDVISPMIYPSHFYGPFQGIAKPGDRPFALISEACRRFMDILQGERATLRPWVQAFPFGTSRFDETYVLEELRALRDSKARGWLFWSAGNAYDVTWDALGRWNRRTPGGRSRTPWFSKLETHADE